MRETRLVTPTSLFFLYLWYAARRTAPRLGAPCPPWKIQDRTRLGLLQMRGRRCQQVTRHHPPGLFWKSKVGLAAHQHGLLLKNSLKGGWRTKGNTVQKHKAAKSFRGHETSERRSDSGSSPSPPPIMLARTARTAARSFGLTSPAAAMRQYHFLKGATAWCVPRPPFATCARPTCD